MPSSRPFAVFVGGAFCVAIVCVATARGATPEVRLGPPYQAGGMWFVPAADPSYDQEGTVAEYGAGLEGRSTVSGERFDPRALTAAHATLPVPGLVEVTNLDTKKTVTLRINDRGPYAPGRILSVTSASARALGMTPGQPAHVRVRYANAPQRRIAAAPAAPVVAPASPRFAAPPPMRSTALVGGYGVQVGAFGDRARAEQVAARAASAGRARISPVERGGSTLYRVVVGPLADVHAAETARDALGDLGFEQAKVIPAA